MTITAQSADGVQHQFPDGTPDAVIDKAMRAYATQTASTPAPTPPAQPNTAIDVARSIPGGLAQGAASIAGLPGDLKALTERGINYGIDSIFGSPQTPTRQAPYAPRIPTSGDVNNVLSAPTGGYYDPKTTAGRYAETIASFAPAAVGGEGGIAARALRVAIPAAGSQAGGDIAGAIDPSLEPYGRVVGAVAGGAGMAGARPVIRSLNSVVNSATGSGFLDPAKEAAQRLRTAVQSDGGLPALTAKTQDYAASGASTPSLIDVGGLNVRRLVRAAAAPEGPAQNAAVSYADRIRANLQDRVTARAGQLTPGAPQSAADYGAQLAERQGAEARTNYAAPYSQPATVTPEMVSALQGPEGRGAIGRAYAAARANRDEATMAELRDLQSAASHDGATVDPVSGAPSISLQEALANLSSRSLDRVRIAMRDIGGSLYQRGARDIARGYRGRVNDIDTALDQTPGLQDARAAYRGTQAAIDAVPVGEAALRMPSSDYAAEIARLSDINPAARYAAGVGHRQAIVNDVERPAASQTGVLSKLASSDLNKANLATSFGPEGARFQRAVQNEVDRLRNANYVAPTSGSPTDLRNMDRSLIGPALRVDHLGLLLRAWDWVRGRTAGLTSAERAEIVRMGISEADLNALRARSSRLPRGGSLAISGALAAGGNRTQP